MINDILETMSLSEESFDTGALTARAVLSFPASSPVFQGHFPGQPILAGAYQMALAKYFIQRLLKKAILIKGIKRSKFSALIENDQEIQLEITLNLREKPNLYEGKIKIRKGEAPAMTSTLSLESHDALP